MFGYIKPYRPEMKMKEYDTYKAVYCGLCKQMGQIYSPLARITLSFDFTFLSFIVLGLRDEFHGFSTQRCAVNPFKRKKCHVSCDDLYQISTLAMLMMYYKQQDNLRDGKIWIKLLSLLSWPFVKTVHDKAKKIVPDLDQMLAKTMIEQQQIEQNGCDNIDQAAQPTAQALAYIVASFSQDPTQRLILSRFGYLLGRYVYFMDAIDDLEEDRQQKNYNVFLICFGEDREGCVDGVIQLLNMTIAEIAAAYELLSLKRFRSILDNIIYLGLHENMKTVLKCSVR